MAGEPTEKRHSPSAKAELSLLYNLFLTELKLKYKNSFLGFIWALLEPLLIAITLLIVFTRLFTNSLSNFPAYILVGFTAWFFFANGTGAVNVIVRHSNLIKRVRFKRELLVLSVCAVSFFNSILEFGILMIILRAIGVKFAASAVFLPIVLFLQFLFVFGVLLAVSSLFVFVRDMDKIWAIVLQVGFFLTPICYPQSLLIKRFTVLLTINPMMHFINVYRGILVYGKPLTFDSFVVLSFISLTFLLVGYVIFRRLEPWFSEMA